MPESLTPSEIVEIGERQYFHRRLQQRAALPIDWTDVEVRDFVVRGVQPERVRQAGEEQWARGEADARQAQERQERSRGGVVQLRHDAVGWRGEKIPPQAVKLIRRYYEHRVPERRSVPRQRERRPQSRTARASASGTDPPESDEDPDLPLTELQQAHLLLLEALVVASRGGLRTFTTFLSIAATRIAAEIARLTDWGER